MPGPASALLASLWVGLAIFALAAIARALILAWKDTRIPTVPPVRWALNEGRSPRAAA